MKYIIPELLILIFVLIFIASVKVKSSIKYQTFICLIICLLLSFIAFEVNPIYEWDLYKHFIFMDQIRGSHLSLFGFLTQNIFVVGGWDYGQLYAFNIFRYILCHLTVNNHWLPAICVFTDYCIIFGIVIDWLKTHKKSTGDIILMLMLGSSFLPFIHANSGMRNALAACIAGLAIYSFLYKEKSIIIFIVLMIIAITIHPAVLIAIPFSILSKFNIKTKGIVIVFMISIFSNIIANLFLNSQIIFLYSIGKRYLRYASEDQYRGASVYAVYGVLIISILFMCMFLMTNFKTNKNKSDNAERQIYYFIFYYLAYIIGNIGNYDLVLRPAYIPGVLSPVMITFLSDKNVWSGYKKKYTAVLILIIKVVIGMICAYISLKYFLTYISVLEM